MLVAIKSVAILPSGLEKLADLERELKLLKGLMHPNVLGLDTLYVDLQEDSSWIRMELMERSLADVIGLVTEGLILQERMMARFASDVLEVFVYLQSHGIAHRDVRSDNIRAALRIIRDEDLITVFDEASPRSRRGETMMVVLHEKHQLWVC